MNNQDKFEEYLRSEMGSLEYSGEDQMWNKFKPQMPAPSLWQQLGYWPLVVSAIVAGGIGYSLLSTPEIEVGSELGSITQDQMQDNNTLNGEDDNSSVATVLTENSDDEAESKSERTLREDQKVSKNENTIALPTSREVKSKSTTLSQKTKSIRTNSNNEKSGSKLGKQTPSTVVNDTLKNRIESIGLPSNRENRVNKSRTILVEDQDGIEWISIINEPATRAKSFSVNPSLDSIGHLNRIEYSTINSNRSMLLKAFERSNLKTIKLKVLKRPRLWAGVLGAATSSTGYQAYTMGLNYSQSTSKRFDFNLSVGLQYESGNIVSQDSIIKTINVSIFETNKDKDLNDLVALYISAVPLYKFGQIGIGVGPKITYGIYNRFLIVEKEAAVNTPDFNSYIYPFGSESYLTQDWSSLNRLRVGGQLVLAYQSRSRFRMQLHLSKNFTKLIKDDLAVTDRSNSPLTVGLQLNYLIKY